MDSLWPIVLIAFSATLFATLLRWSGVQRPATIAGLLAGALAGPTIFGRVMPDLYERWYEGGVTQRLALEELDQRQAADRAALGSIGDMSPQAFVELEERHRLEREPLVEAWSEARAAHREPVLWFGAVLAGLILGWAGPGARRSLMPSAGEGLFVSLWTIVLSVGVVGVTAVYLVGAEATEGIALGFCFAVTGRVMAPELRSLWREAQTAGVDADERSETQRELLYRIRAVGVAEATSILLWMVALFGLVFAVVRPEPSDFMLPALFVGGMFCGKTLAGARPESKSGLNAFIEVGPLPALAGLLIASVDLWSAALIAPALLGLIIGADARWLGAATGARLVGVRWREAWRLTTPLVDAGAVQLATATLLVAAGWLSTTLMIGAYAGAAMCDLTLGWRDRLLRLADEATDLDPESSRDDEA